jgi:hypothetical protein
MPGEPKAECWEMSPLAVLRQANLPTGVPGNSVMIQTLHCSAAFVMPLASL